MLYLENPPGTFTAWRGEPLNDVIYPLSIETVWTPEDLAAEGLYVPVEPEVPAGKIVVSFTVERVNGVVTKVCTLEDEPPQPLPDLLPYQFRAMLKLSGKEADLLTFMDGLPEPDQTIAKAKLEYTLVFHRDNDLVLAAQQALALTDEALDGLWTQASTL